MFNVFRNNIARIHNKKEELNLISIVTRSMIKNNNKNLINNYSKFNFITNRNLNKNFYNKNTEKKDFFNQQINFSKLKLNKIFACSKFSTKTEITENPVKIKKSTKPTVIDENPEFYKYLIEEISKSPKLNEEEKSALKEKLQNFFTEHVELNNQRKGKKWIEVYYDIVRKLGKEDNEIEEQNMKMIRDVYHESEGLFYFLFFFNIQFLYKKKNLFFWMIYFFVFFFFFLCRFYFLFINC